MHLSLVLVFSLLFARTVSAAELVQNYLSARAMGMGGAYATIAKGHDAIFVNPAGLATHNDFQWRISGLTLGINGIDSFDEYQDLFDNSDDVASVVNQMYDKPVWARLDFMTSVNFKALTIGAYGSSNAGLTVTNPAYPQIEPGYFAEYGAFLGWGVELVPQYFDFGFLLKRATRYAGSGSIGASSIAYLDSDVLESQFKRKGTGYSADIGAKLKFPVDWNPTIGFVWKNVGHTSFDISADNPKPASLPDQMDVGLGFEKDFSAFIIRPALEYKYLNGSDIQFGKKVHAGVELEFPLFILRGGLNQGYWTAGATLDLWFLQVDAATYGVEMGEYPGQDEDRRYVVQLVADFGFNLSTGDFFSMSKARKLQQREARRGLKQRR
ncbi:MAG: hypothetical protein K2Q26_14320 [Bdellovibrionales bacterium]|nr:hypothetical protein [Bdellovibrionales bacterium]